jgi:hypothetical protein
MEKLKDGKELSELLVTSQKPQARVRCQGENYDMLLAW